MQWVKQFKTMIPESIQIMIIGVIAAVFVLLDAMNQTRLLPLIGALVSSISLAFIVVYLAFKKSLLLAYIIIFIVGFSNGIRNFFITITSFWMNGFNFFGTFDIEVIVALVVCAYLMLMIISYGIEETFSWKMPRIESLLLTLLFIGFIYLNYGFIAVLYIGAILLVLYHKAMILSLLFMLFYTIEMPLQAIDLFFLKTAKFTTLHYWLFTLYATAIVVLIVLTSLKKYKKGETPIEIESA